MHVTVIINQEIILLTFQGLIFYCSMINQPMIEQDEQDKHIKV